MEPNVHASVQLFRLHALDAVIFHTVEDMGHVHPMVVFGHRPGGLHPVAPCHALGSIIVVPDDGIHLRHAKRLKRIPFTALCGLRRISIVPIVLAEEIADFHHAPAVARILHGKARLPYKGIGPFQQHGPQAKAVRLIARDLPVQPFLHLFATERVLIRIHGGFIL